MIHVFRSDGTYSSQSNWPRTAGMVEGDYLYFLEFKLNQQNWYLYRPRIGSMPVNLSDVPPQYIKISKMLNLILPKE